MGLTALQAPTVNADQQVLMGRPDRWAYQGSKAALGCRASTARTVPLDRLEVLAHREGKVFAERRASLESTARTEIAARAGCVVPKARWVRCRITNGTGLA